MTWTVTKATDDGTANTLRWAIGQAQNGDTIAFSIGAQGSYQTITLNPTLGPLPSISKSITIDGWSQMVQGGPTDRLYITISGQPIRNGEGLATTANNVTIKGLAIVSFANGAGILLDNPAGNAGDTVLGCNLGADYTGLNALPNEFGIHIKGGHNTIGGTAALSRCIISGNTQDGVWLDNTGAQNNQITGNYIGVDQTGNGAEYNHESGIFAAAGAANNTIGGTDVGAGNVISGNLENGIKFISASSNQILGNKIGIGADGKTRIPNNQDGVLLQSSSDTNTIGAANAGNVISYNGRNGIHLNITGKNNKILGNLIGTAADGKTAAPNGLNGVLVESGTPDDPGSSNTTIGGVNAGEANTISANLAYGINLTGSAPGNCLVAANYIGTTSDGTAALGNGSSGLLINSNSNTVGVVGAAAHNVISSNTVGN
jgi:hypothetical protein